MLNLKVGIEKMLISFREMRINVLSRFWANSNSKLTVYIRDILYICFLSLSLSCFLYVYIYHDL